MVNPLDFEFDFGRGNGNDPSLSEDLGISHLLPEMGGDGPRILLISDIHANWEALQAVLLHAQGRYDTIWFLGDVVGYGPEPVNCVRFVRDHLRADQWRAGNHDLGVAECVKNGWSGRAKTILPIHRKDLQVHPVLWDWFCESMTFGQSGPDVKSTDVSQQVLTHANLQNDLETDFGYLYPGGNLATRQNLFQLREYVSNPQLPSWLLAGHTHIPCLFRLPMDESEYLKARPQTIRWGEPVKISDGHYYINPGSVGEPRDGNPDACYAILDRKLLDVTWHRVPYDIDKVVTQLNAKYQGHDLALVKNASISMLRHGGSARTESNLYPAYRKDPSGLIAI